ncbi:hypothetical protein ABLA30_04590 [Xenorhabdus nematophila]|uniref:hypothetical protein n=1 Tax=Xenorhabdus TaxID=626 RepID=UPI0011612731|nr:hypothetical protein [Xenorhabdus eapokensis]
MQAAVPCTQPIPRNTSTCVHSGAQISIKGKAVIFCFARMVARQRSHVVKHPQGEANESID